MAENFFESMVAAQMASGGQNVITPENVNRIMSLAAQQEAQRRLGLAAGRQAVAERMNQQIMTGQRAAPNAQGEIDMEGRDVGSLAAQGRVITAPSGARFVTDAQGNVVGSSGVPTGRTVFQETEEGQVAGRGAGPTTTLGERIRSSFIEEMSRAAPATARASMPAAQAAAQAVPQVTEQVSIFDQLMQPSAVRVARDSGQMQGANATQPPASPEEELIRAAEEAPKQQAKEASMRELESLKKQRENILTQLKERTEVSLPMSASGMTMPFSRTMQSEARAKAAAKARELEKQIAALEASLK